MHTLRMKLRGPGRCPLPQSASDALEALCSRKRKKRSKLTSQAATRDEFEEVIQLCRIHRAKGAVTSVHHPDVALLGEKLTAVTGVRVHGVTAAVHSRTGVPSRSQQAMALAANGVALK